MPIADSLLPEFDQEMANTRKMLEAIPNDKLSFKPHEKNWDMASLATHLATIPSWGADTMNTESLDFTGYKPPAPATSREELLAQFDKGVASARAAIAGAADPAFAHTWTLSGNGQTFFSMPRGAVIRSFVMNHLIHHRAQLGMYLRMAGAHVPGMYGPSADEPMM
jgi:uncharacterized damage-inducible protein DinB